MPIQDLIIKISRLKESKPKESKLTNKKAYILSCSNFTKPKKTFCQDKKKQYFKKKRDQKNSILAIRDNIIKSEKNQSNKKCYNCQKKSHFIRNYFELLKNKF